MDNIFFIIGSFRSGTTAMAKVLNLAANAEVHIELAPKLSREARDLYEGKLTDPIKVLKDSRQNDIDKTLEKGLIFGDKNANYLSFVPHLVTLWSCKLVFVIRDGRNVVRSLMDWQHVVKSQIFKRDEDSNDYVFKPIENDYWDYSLIRPKQGTSYFNKWKTMTQFEKICWYWSNYNKILLELIKDIPKDKYNVVFLDKSNLDEIKSLYFFLHLKGFDIEKVNNLLNSRVNSAKDRGNMDDLFPAWAKWDNWHKERFKCIAGDMMEELGYWQKD